MKKNLITNHCSESTADAYRNTLLRKNRYFILLAVLGLLMVAAAMLNLTLHFAPDAMDIVDLYCIIGCTLIALSAAKLFQNRRLLHNEALFQKARLKNTDERNLAISAKAIQGAAGTVIIGCYFAMLIGGFFNMTVFWCFWIVIMLFGLAYCIFWGYYNAKM